MEIQLYDGATNECCDGLATRRYKSLFRYWAQRERGLKKKKKKGPNLNLGVEEEGSDVESRGEDNSDKVRLQEMQLFSLRTDPSLPASPGPSFSCIPTTNHPYSHPSKILLKIHVFSMIVY